VDLGAGLDDMENSKLLTIPGLELRPGRSQSLYRLRYVPRPKLVWYERYVGISHEFFFWKYGLLVVLFFNFPLYLQAVPVHSANIVKSRTKACDWMISLLETAVLSSQVARSGLKHEVQRFISSTEFCLTET
jgi:hypothetical protein